MRLFRVEELGGWAELMKIVAAELREFRVSRWDI